MYLKWDNALNIRWNGDERAIGKVNLKMGVLGGHPFRRVCRGAGALLLRAGGLGGGLGDRGGGAADSGGLGPAACPEAPFPERPGNRPRLRAGQQAQPGVTGDERGAGAAVFPAAVSGAGGAVRGDSGDGDRRDFQRAGERGNCLRPGWNSSGKPFRMFFRRWVWRLRRGEDPYGGALEASAADRVTLGSVELDRLPAEEERTVTVLYYDTMAGGRGDRRTRGLLPVGGAAHPPDRAVWLGDHRTAAGREPAGLAGESAGGVRADYLCQQYAHIL